MMAEPTLIERIAVALANYDARQVDVPEIASVDEFRFEHERATYLACARTVLEAIREPSEPMVERGLLEAESCTDDWTSAAACLPGHVWKAMIGAALEEAHND